MKTKKTKKKGALVECDYCGCTDWERVLNVVEHVEYRMNAKGNVETAKVIEELECEELERNCKRCMEVA